VKQEKSLRQVFATIHWVALLCFSLTLANCANEKTPEGGKKDTIPPKPRKMVPANKSLHFNSKTIEITFNEFIKATGFAQTLISPPMEKRPEFKIDNKTLIIKLKGKLRDSTTYTINFAEDIKDVNEGNILNNFTYVFSTGDFIYSQKVSGKVFNAKDNTPADGVIVSLYPPDSINAIKRSKPFYFAKTDKSGSFKISNIKAGKYRVFTLKDANYDYLYNQPNEMIGFADSLVDLSDTIPKNVELKIFQEAFGKLSYAGDKSLKPGCVQIYFSRPVDSLEMESSIQTDNDFSYFNSTRDTITYWYSKYYEKRMKMFLVVNDTLKDTVRIELQSFDKDSIFKKPKYYLAIDNQLNGPSTGPSSKDNINTLELYKPLKIFYNRPITGINPAKAFHLYEDTVKKELPVKFDIDKKTKQSVEFSFEKKENMNYELEIPDSAFQDIFGTWNQKYKYKFKTSSKDNYGNLNVILKCATTDKNYVVRILDASDALVKEIYFSHQTEMKVSVPNVPSGTYKVTAIDDVNGNGKWDTGNFKTKTQPEKIISFKDTYTLKGGWDLDMEIKL
jgi:uncharacterized protein (DUF2141 family)